MAQLWLRVGGRLWALWFFEAVFFFFLRASSVFVRLIYVTNLDCFGLKNLQC
jgi:hypothetical protein